MMRHRGASNLRAKRGGEQLQNMHDAVLLRRIEPKQRQALIRFQAVLAPRPRDDVAQRAVEISTLSRMAPSRDWMREKAASCSWPKRRKP